MFFRGFWLGVLRRSFGSGAIFAMAVPYCMIHFGKPYLEAVGAIVAGIALGSLSMKTKSIYQGFLVHITVAALMDWLSLRRRHCTPLTWWAPDNAGHVLGRSRPARRAGVEDREGRHRRVRRASSRSPSSWSCATAGEEPRASEVAPRARAPARLITRPSCRRARPHGPGGSGGRRRTARRALRGRLAERLEDVLERTRARVKACAPRVRSDERTKRDHGRLTRLIEARVRELPPHHLLEGGRPAREALGRAIGDSFDVGATRSARR